MEHGSAKIKELVCGLTSNRWRSKNPCPMRLTPSLKPGPWALRQPLSHRLSLPKSSLVPLCVKARQGAPEAAGSGPSLAPSIRPFIHPADVADCCGPGAVQEETAQGSCPQHEDFRRQTRTAFGSCPVCDSCVFTFTSGDQLYQEL